MPDVDPSQCADETRFASFRVVLAFSHVFLFRYQIKGPTQSLGHWHLVTSHLTWLIAQVQGPSNIGVSFLLTTQFPFSPLSGIFAFGARWGVLCVADSMKSQTCKENTRYWYDCC